MELPTLREETCRRRLAYFRRRMAAAELMTASERAQLIEEMQAFADSLSTGNGVLGGAGIGLGASILPVIGTVTGPIVGGLYGAYKSKKLARYRREVLRMITELE